MKTIFLILLGIAVLNADFIRDDTTGIVTDTTEKLEWQDDAASLQMNWHEAIGYCENLDLNGSGWRLPNINQLNSTLDYTNSPSVNPAFAYPGSAYYFSSTTHLDSTIMVFLINSDGDNAYSRKTDTHYVRCVRTAQ